MKTYNYPSVATFMLAACIITANTSSAVSERFTSSGTFTPPAGITSVTVECWGGGGAGGAASKTVSTSSGNNAGGGGGAGGAYARRVNVPVIPGTPYTITIPAAVGNNTFTTGTRVNGADVTFTGEGGVTCTATGGQGGESITTTGSGGTALGGVGSTVGCVGDVFFAGGNGGSSPGNGGGGGGGPSDLAVGGSTATTGTGLGALGSDAIHNGGNGGAGKTGSGAGNSAAAGGIAGAGAGGKAPGSGATGSNIGGNGAKGQIIITYSGATVVKANNADDLNLTTSWVGGNAPDSTGIAKWDSTVTSANTTLLGADLTWGSINIANPGGLVTIDPGIAPAHTLTNNGGIDMSAATADFTLNCGLVLGGPAVWNVAASRTLTVGGIVSGAQSITKQGDGKVILSAANTYSGATAINGGTLQLGAGDVIPHDVGNGDVSVAATGTLDLNSYSDTINGLSGGGIVDNTAASTASTLTVGGNNASGTFSGVIQDSGSASTLNLVKTGSGTLTLSGANIFSGTMTVNGGRLAVANTSALTNISGFTIGGASLGVNVANLVITAPITLSGNMTVISNGSGATPVSFNGAIGGTGNISFTTEANSFSGADTRASIGASGNFVGNITISTQNVANNMTVQLGAVDALPTTAVVTLDGGNGNGTTYSDLDLFGFSQTLAGLTNITRTSRLQRVYNSNANPAVTLTINNSADYTFGGRLGKTGDTNLALTKSDIGIFTLTGNNPFTGATKITAGILNLGNSLALQGSPLDTLNSIMGDATNGLQTTVTTLTLGGLTGNKNLADVFTTTAGGYDAVTALTLNPGTGATPVYTGAIADGAIGMTLTKSGAGTQTLAGANNYTGATTISGGTLALGAANTLPDTSAVLIGAATLNAATAGTETAGTLDITAAATISVATGARLVFADSSPVNSGTWAGTLTLTGNLDFSGGPTSSLNFGSISGLTSAQLLAISSDGFTNFALDAEGDLTATPVSSNTFADWLLANAPATGFVTDTDKDGLSNGVENVLGSNPNTYNAGLTEISSTTTSVTFKHTLNPTIASDVTRGYEWSTDMTEWKTHNQINTGGTTATISASEPVSGVVTVTITITGGPSAKLFGRLVAVN